MTLVTGLLPLYSLAAHLGLFATNSLTAANSGSLHLSLLRTCRTVYREAQTVLYGGNTFVISVGEALQTLPLLSPGRTLVRHLILEFSNYEDLVIPFPPLARKHLRYFRALRDLALRFPQTRSEKYWEVLLGQDVLSDKPSPLVNMARESLVQTLDWLPIHTKVTVIGANFGQDIGQIRKEGAKDHDHKMEEAIRNATQNRARGERSTAIDSDATHLS
jgi:hypothetical protein